MAITDPLVLPDDVIITPVTDLPAYLRERMEYVEGDHVITRPRSRTASFLFSRQTAELLKLFATPTTFVQAVIHFSRASNADPETVLTDAFPIIQDFLHASFLVTADTQHTQRILPSFTAGQRVAGCEIMRCVHIVEDTEVYQAKRGNEEIVALKISRSEQDRAFMLAREISIVKRLDGQYNPRFLEAGTDKGHLYLVTEWCSGAHVSVVAQELRHQPRSNQRKQLLHLCTSIIDSYEHLHDQGVIHADIHPGNIFVLADGSIRIIDYGLAYDEKIELQENVLVRADINYYSEPEYAKAILVGKKAPLPSTSGEQFSLAALLYHLLTGAQYLKFPLERAEVLQRIVYGGPLPFSRWGVTPWPAVESLLVRALSRHSDKRFPSLSAFARSLHEADVSDLPSPFIRAAATTSNLATEQLLTDVLQRLDFAGPLFPSSQTIAPLCSLTYGETGIAYALYRIACVQNNARLLSLADAWSTKALQNIKTSTAFYNDEDFIAETISPASPYYTASGVYCVQALISHARGDFTLQNDTIDAFVASSQKTCAKVELTFGRAGTLLASTFLLDITSRNATAQATSLRVLGNTVMQDIWEYVNTLAAIPQCSEIRPLGIAHGWAGLLYATLCWCQSSQAQLPHAMDERLQQLAACAERKGRGVRWKPAFTQPGREQATLYMPGWCNGSAGYIHLWILAHQMFGDPLYARLTEEAAWNTWEEKSVVSNLCCGLTGQAYGLLNLYKHTGERVWLTRAQELAQQAVLNIADSAHITLKEHRDSLYHGDVGTAVLVADLTRPEEACMPFFGKEGWPDMPGEPFPPL
jgi:serine/threonine-protein kinase